MCTALQLGLIPAPKSAGGREFECLSDERFQLILLQACAEFPLNAFSHLLPVPTGRLHLFEHVKSPFPRNGRRYLSRVRSLPKSICHFPAYSLDSVPWFMGSFKGKIGCFRRWGLSQ